MPNNKDLEAQAQQLYVSYYGRPADPAGLAFWVEKFSESDNIDQVIEDFGTSDEYLDWIEDNELDTSEALINALYQQMFNRDADEEGLAFYVDQLESGVLTLASIALDIANGASGDDLTILNNKIEVANAYTEEVEATESMYSSDDILAASAILAEVDGTDASVEVGNAASVAAVGLLPKIMDGGEYNLDEDTAIANYSGATSAVQVTLDGRDDEADFDVKGSVFDDLVIVEEFRSAKLDGNDGTDTLDLSELSGSSTTSQVTVTLLGGTFSYNTADASFLGTISGFENVIGTDGDDIITGDLSDNIIWGGEGDDTLKGGVGDDTFVFEDEEDLAESKITGGIGIDTLEFTGASIDITSPEVAPLIDVEALVLSNLDEEDSVEIKMDGDQIASFDTITGSSVIDTLSTVDGSIDLSDTVLIDIEVLDKITTAGDITIAEGSFAGAIQIVGYHAPDPDPDTDRLISSGNTGDVIDVSMLILNHIKTIELQGVGETLIISQTQIDALLAISNDEIFGSASNESDSLAFSSSIDLGGIVGEDIPFGSINYGEAESVVFTDLADAPNLFTVIGTSLNNVLAIVDTDETENLTGIALVDIEHLVIDPDDEGTEVIIDELTLRSINILEGDFTLTALTNHITGDEYINLLGMTFDGDILLSSSVFDGNTEDDSFLVNQDVIDSIAGTSGFAGANLITVGDLDMSSEDLTLAEYTKVIALNPGATITAASAVNQIYILLEGGTVIPTQGGTTGDEGNIVFGSDNSDTITASYVEGGGSNDKLTGGAGSDIFNVSMKAMGVALTDFNTGTARDTLNLEIGVGTATVAGTRTFLTNFTDVLTIEGGSNTADPFTVAGGLRFLNASSVLVGVPLGSALGSTVALPEVHASGGGGFTGITYSVTGGGALVTFTTIDATITSELIKAVTGLSTNSLVNTTFVRFYVIKDITSKKQVSGSATQTNTFNQLYAVIVGAGSAENSITANEVSITLVATLGASTLSGADIILV